MKDKFKKILTKVYAFAGAFALSLTIVNALPGTKERRQRLFAAAAADGDYRTVRKLRSSGAHINSRANCCMPLFLAAGSGRLEVVRFLIDEGADVNAREQRGATALTEAVYYGHLSVVKELLSRGADVNAGSEEGTALDIATRKRSPAIADLLRHHGGRRVCELRKCN